MSITLILIVITAGISLYAWKNENLLDKWVFYPYGVQKYNQWYRFVTSGFLHADLGHLFFNMFSLYFFGEVVEGIYKNTFGSGLGAIFFVGLYLTGIIVSDLPTYFKYRKDQHYHSLGASGGVSTIIFASIIYYPLNKICLYGIICPPGIVIGVLYLIYSYYEARQNRDNVNHDAHFYGALIGVVLALVLVPEAGPDFIRQISEKLPF